MTAGRNLRNLALIGFMGTGKSSVGRLLAHQLRYEFVDTDDLLEARAGKPISQIFTEDGEDVFRRMERELVSEMPTWTSRVIATGGGLAAVAANLESLKTHALVVCLWASPEAIWQRVKHQTHRPLLQEAEPLQRIRALLESRTPVYRQADVLINTDLRSVKDVAQQVLHQFQDAHQERPRTS
jgi:shikimate kinase